MNERELTMKLLKISLALLLAVCTLFTLAACKEEKEESSKEETESTASEVSEVSENSESSEPETSEPESSEPETSEPETSEPETSEPETSEPEAPSNSSVIGTWEYDEDITHWLKTGQAHNSEYATIINSIDITFYQTHRFTFDGTQMTMISYVKDAKLDELLEKVSSYNLSYDDLELNRYDARGEVYPTPYRIEDGKIFIDGGYIKYTCTANELEFIGLFDNNNNPINAEDSPFLNSTFKKISANVNTNIPEYNN